MPLRDSAVAHGLVFDKMDFSSLYQGAAEGKAKTDASAGQQGGNGAKVDLSYYKTPVPMSLVNSKARKKRGKGKSSENGASEKEQSSRRKR